MSDIITKAIEGSNVIAPAMHDGELRILDTDLATRLGFDRPRDIRKLIKRYEAELGRMGRCATVARRPESGGHTVTEYYLNEEQALFITAKSETAAATKITIEIVTQFAAFKRGKAPTPKPSIPQTYAEALIEAGKMAMERDEARSEVERHKQALGEAKPKADAHDYLASLPGELGVQNAGRELKVGQKWVTDYIDGHGWSCVQGKKRVPAHYGLKMEYVRLVPETYKHPYTGEEMVKHDFRITQKGLRRLAEIIAATKTKNESKAGLRNLAKKAGSPPFAKKPEPVS
ncbi:phage antirepressor KilAC domain-containing protein [Gluconobacter oxydans]|uniref:phage antirepressor KilAC domain-containing protein n=1 Tax=Gluconobacter oxydans TaxID=442 RepID=UPI003464D37A